MIFLELKAIRTKLVEFVGLVDYVSNYVDK